MVWGAVEIVPWRACGGTCNSFVLSVQWMRTIRDCGGSCRNNKIEAFGRQDLLNALNHEGHEEHEDHTKKTMVYKTYR